MYEDHPDYTQQLASVFAFSVYYVERRNISQYELYRSVS